MSPRRVMNVKIPNAESRLHRNPSVVAVNENLHYSSRSVDFPRAPIIVSTFKHRRLSSIAGNLSAGQGQLKPDLSQISIDSENFKQRGKSLMRGSMRLAKKSGIYESVTSFIAFIENTYRKIYEEIDISQKGFITVDDFINLVMFIELINSGGKTSPKNIENYDKVKGKAEEILNVFGKVSKSNKVTKKDFFAVCSLFEFTKHSASSFNVLDEEMRNFVVVKIQEFEKVFQCYAKEGRIRMKDLHNILLCLDMPDQHQLEGLLYLENIDLVCFFRYLPLFSFIHSKVLKSLSSPP